ncbi:tetratricopeptide repeat protein [Agaribacter marinus]|uniref:Tetratricopeptide repeat-containing protein n=1 Tax=Agaribacter marinus TaxID=1431249 RepID=A0AA37WJT5_9ALTE|nr:hypothetical protein [Agaribacter marinus]GLR70220.1 hypothetical protein GCM10007852_11280 [Agaribacter marinus]
MESRKRKRGLRASRDKLALAIENAGFKTQHALAEAIASEEGLAKPPKDLVSKVFNEKAVSEKNFLRVARALKVAPHEIFLSNDSEGHTEDLVHHTVVQSENLVCDDNGLKQNLDAKQILSTNTSAVNGQRSPLFKQQAGVKHAYLWGLVILLGLAFLWFYANSTNDQVLQSTKIETPLGKVLIVLQSPPELNKLALALVEQSKAMSELNVMLPESPSAYFLSNDEVFTQLKAHAVMRLSVENTEFYAGLKVSISSPTHQRVLSNIFARHSEIKASTDVISQRIMQGLLSFVDGQPLGEQLVGRPEVFSRHLLALNDLFLSQSKAGLQAVEQQVSEVIALNENFANAYALMCVTKVRMRFLYDSIEALEDAGEYCDKAEALAPKHQDTLAAKILFLSKSGQLVDAILLAEQILNDEAFMFIESADFYALLVELYASVSLDDNVLTNSEEKLNSIEEKLLYYAEKAIDLESRHWHAYNELGNYYFRRGEIGSAKANYLQGSKVVKHGVMLSNLGTTQLCFAEFEQAATTYKSLLDIDTHTYLAYEQLGTVYLFMHDFNKALANKLTAILEQPEISIHQLWGSVGEIYRLLGNKEKAYDYFYSALQHVERDLLLESANNDDKLHALYYQAKLQSLAPSEYQMSHLETRVKAFLDNQQRLGLKAKSHLAWLAGKIGEDNQKQAIVSQISSICPAYEHSPELH